MDVRPLVVDAAAGQQRAWDDLVDRFAPLVWAVARGHGLPPALAADVAQTVWLRFAESLSQAGPDGEPTGGWLAQETRAEALNALRWADPKRELPAAGADALVTALEQLPSRARLALRLATVPGVSTGELAGGLGLPGTRAVALVDESLQRLSAVVGGSATGLRQRLRELDDDLPAAALLTAARAAYSWRTPEGQTTPTSYDSLFDEGLATVRSTAGPRLLSFAGGGLELDLEVSVHGSERRLLGQLSPAVRVRVSIRHGGVREVSVEPDELGHFAVDGLLPGPLSVRCDEVAGERGIVTGWVLV